MTDGSGVVQARYSFDPYGRVTKLQGSLDSDFQFAGYYIHQRSGHFLTVLRAYNPLSGRWISRDPIEEAGGVNLYEYVENGPLSDIDPDGTATFVEFNIGDWIKKILEWLKKCIPSKPPKKPPEEPPGGGDGGAPPDDGDDGPPYEDPDKKKPGDDIPPDTKPKPDTVDENHDPWWMDDPWGKLPDKSGSDAPWWQDWKPFFGF